MSRGPHLNVLSGLLGALEDGASPSVEAAREKLGGPAPSPSEGDRRAGSFVRLPRSALHGGVGVVLCAAGEELDVWIGAGRVRRLPAASTAPIGREDPAIGGALLDLSAAIGRFASLTEEQEVEVTERSGARWNGRLLEKCRYGALVLAPAAGDQGERVVAVGFRGLDAASTAASEEGER
jgi:hypothetical protein